jgi:5-dehydro-2-deoxygluconokinase
LEAPAEELIRCFETTLAAPSVKGFAVGRTIFSDAARAWMSGGMNDEEAIADMAGRFRQLTQAWLKTRGLE